MTGMVAEHDPASENLDVYDTKSGWWHPVLGDLSCPTVGSSWRPEMRSSPDGESRRRVLERMETQKPTRRPSTTARSTRPERCDRDRPRRCERDSRAAPAARVASTRHRDRVEADYRLEMREAVYRWLAFPPAHADLASQIADGAAAQQPLSAADASVEPRRSASKSAPLAARAYIRHHYTDYDDRLDNATGSLGDDIDTDDYREIKRAAHDAVEAFLAEHRHHDATGVNTT